MDDEKLDDGRMVDEKTKKKTVVPRLRKQVTETGFRGSCRNWVSDRNPKQDSTFMLFRETKKITKQMKFTFLADLNRFLTDFKFLFYYLKHAHIYDKIQAKETKKCT